MRRAMALSTVDCTSTTKNTRRGPCRPCMAAAGTGPLRIRSFSPCRSAGPTWRVGSWRKASYVREVPERGMAATASDPLSLVPQVTQATSGPPGARFRAAPARKRLTDGALAGCEAYRSPSATASARPGLQALACTSNRFGMLLCPRRYTCRSPPVSYMWAIDRSTSAARSRWPSAPATRSQIRGQARVPVDR